MLSKQPPQNRTLFCQRSLVSSLATASPEDWSPPPQPMRLKTQAQYLSPEKLQPHNGKQQLRRDIFSRNNTEVPNDVSDDANRAAPGNRDGACSDDQLERLAKCQKSLDQLEYSLNSLLLGSSLAPKSEKRLAKADAFLSDLLDSINANRTRTRTFKRPQSAKPPMSKAELDMRQNMESESHTMWRAQHVGGRCEDTVDRYMLDVVMDRVGAMADLSDWSGQKQKAQLQARKRDRQRKRPQEVASLSCSKCGGLVKDPNSKGEGNNMSDASEDKKEGNRHNCWSTLSCETISHNQGISFAKPLQDILRPHSSKENQLEQMKQSHRVQLRENVNDSSASEDNWTLCSWQPTSDQPNETNSKNHLSSDVGPNDGTNNNNCCSLGGDEFSAGQTKNFCNELDDTKNRASSSRSTKEASQSSTEDQIVKQVEKPANDRPTIDLAANVAGYNRSSKRYAKALRVATYLRDACRKFYQDTCASRAPPVMLDLEAILDSLTELIDMRDRTVALAVRCTGCSGLCPAERLSSPQLQRLQALLRLACTTGDNKDKNNGQLDLIEALADADGRPNRCQLLRQLQTIATHPDYPGADYRHLINALASQTELANCAANFAAHRRRMCGTVPPVAPGPCGLTREDMCALAVDLAPIETKFSTSGKQRKRLRRVRQSDRGRTDLPLMKALHNPEEMRRRLLAHQFAAAPRWL